ncbi:hypothetical protein B0H14DRAFT_2819552, partial [Mycena olivaceomarginata]
AGSEKLYCNMIEADIELREKKFDLAKIRFQECLHSIWGIDNEVESFWPSSEWQFRWPVTYLGYAYKTKDNLALHKALLCLGDVFIITKMEKLLKICTLALEGFTQMDVHRSGAQCMIRLGDLANKQGHTSKAIFLWQKARPLFERSLQTTDVAQIDVRLYLATLTAPDRWLNMGSSEIQQVESAHLGVQKVLSLF